MFFPDPMLRAIISHQGTQGGLVSALGKDVKGRISPILGVATTLLALTKV